jgi:hypothetical protein
MAKAQQYISNLAAGGRYHFSTADMSKTFRHIAQRCAAQPLPA